MPGYVRDDQAGLGGQMNENIECEYYARVAGLLGGAYVPDVDLSIRGRGDINTWVARRQALAGSITPLDEPVYSRSI